MPDIEDQSSDDPPIQPGEPDLTFVAIPSERASCLRDLIATARGDLKPRNFAKRHDPEFPKDANGELLELLEDYYFLSPLHLPDRQGLVLEALSRLELRYHRQFASALRLLNSIRRNPDSNSPSTTPQSSLSRPNCAPKASSKGPS